MAVSSTHGVSVNLADGSQLAWRVTWAAYSRTWLQDHGDGAGKDWQHYRKWVCETDTLQLAPAAWPHSSNTDTNTNLAQVSASEITLSKRVRDHCWGGGPILWCNVLKDHRPDITGHCHLCSLSFDSETQKKRVALHLINNQSPPLSPDAGRLQTDKWQRGRRPGSTKVVVKPQVWFRSPLISHNVRGCMCLCR